MSEMTLEQNMEQLKNMSEQLEKLSPQELFSICLPGQVIKEISSYEQLKDVKEDFVKATLANTLVQCANKLDHAGVKDKNIAKNMRDFGIVLKYKVTQGTGGASVNILVEQNGTAILTKSVGFLPSTQKCKGLSEDTSYEGSTINAAYGAVGALAMGGLLVTAGASAVGAAKGAVGAAVEQIALNERVAVANGIKDAWESAYGIATDVSKDLIESGKEIGVNAYNTSQDVLKVSGYVGDAALDPMAKQVSGLVANVGEKAEGEMIHIADNLTQRVGEMSVEASHNAGELSEIVVHPIGDAAKSGATRVVQGIGGVVNSGISKTISAGGKVAGKLGAKGAEEGAAKAGEALMSETAKTISGYATLAAVAVVGGICVYKACQYTPKVYHFYDEDSNSVLSYCLIKNSNDLRELGVDKAGESVFCTVTDTWHVNLNAITEVYPVLPKGQRKSLYGLYSTTSTGWPTSPERTLQVMKKYAELAKTTPIKEVASLGDEFIAIAEKCMAAEA